MAALAGLGGASAEPHPGHQGQQPVNNTVKETERQQAKQTRMKLCAGAMLPYFIKHFAAGPAGSWKPPGKLATNSPLGLLSRVIFSA